MEEYDKRIQSIYNDCWKLYRQYTKTGDMATFNLEKDVLIQKYGNKSDIVNLVWWICVRVQTLHDMRNK